jgi:nucleoside-diphosphate-sugar epimerase
MRRQPLECGCSAQRPAISPTPRQSEPHAPGVERSLLTDLFIAAKQKRKAKMLGPVVVRLLDAPRAFGLAWNLGGAGATTQLELARMAFGGAPRYLALGKTMLRLLGLFDPVLRELVEMNYLVTDPLIVDDSALQQLLGSVAKTPYSEDVRQSLAAAG